MKLAAYKPFSTALTVLLLLALSSPTQAAPIVETESGLIQGVDLGGVNRFLGIPFAEAPVGELRWRPPREKAPGTGSLSPIHSARPAPSCPNSPNGPVLRINPRIVWP